MAIKELVYLGTPYSGTDEQMDFRANMVDIIAKDLANDDIMVYSPISSWHHISCKYKLPRDYKFWKDMCETFVSKSDRLIAVQLPGWEKSIGLTAEIELATSLNIPVEYLDPAPYFKRLDLLTKDMSVEDLLGVGF